MYMNFIHIQFKTFTELHFIKKIVFYLCDYIYSIS